MTLTRALIVGVMLCAMTASVSGGCLGDANNSGTVDVDDLIIVVLDWGCVNPPGPCPGDVDNSGVVNVDDLVTVILNWGPCAPVVGACCIGPSCLDATQAVCTSINGVFQGSGTACSGLNCAIPNDNCSGALTLATALAPAAPVATSPSALTSPIALNGEAA